VFVNEGTVNAQLTLGLPALLGVLLGCGSSGSSAPDGSGGMMGAAASGGAAVSAGRGGSLPNGSAGLSSGGASAASPLPERLQRYHRQDSDRSVRFELDVVSGLAPYASSTQYLSDLMGRLLDKPDGVTFETDETLSPMGEGFEWTFDTLDAFARSHAEDDADGPVTIHVSFVDGRYATEDGGTVLGLAWGQRFIALFQDQLRAGCSGGLLGGLQDSCEVAERNVWAHEIGHVIGLVDNGVVMQSAHRDEEHGRHDVSDACIMYWAYEGPALFDTLLTRFNAGQGPNIDFCDNCWADLTAAR
jgi:hypothetical protein